MLKNLVVTLAILSSLYLASCQDTISNKSNEWFEQTKAEILRQSDLKADSTYISFNEDSSFRLEHYFHDGHYFLKKGINFGYLRLEIHYSLDNDFELRREVCDNSVYGFEGITYKSKFYGLSTWRNCEDGSIETQGVRFNNEHIGTWKEKDKNGNVTTIDHKRNSAVDSLPIIKKIN